jgi:predicted secreted protein
MTVTLGLAIFFVIWWTVLFAVLPFGVRTQAESGEIVQGTPESAPTRSIMRVVFWRTTGVAVIVFGLLWAAIVLNVIPLEGTDPR